MAMFVSTGSRPGIIFEAVAADSPVRTAAVPVSEPPTSARPSAHAETWGGDEVRSFGGGQAESRAVW
jgi:hypothetical protein